MTFNEYKQEVEKENGECQILHSVCDHNEKNCGKTSDRNAPKNVSWIDYWRAMTENYSNTLVCSSCGKVIIVGEPTDDQKKEFSKGDDTIEKRKAHGGHIWIKTPSDKSYIGGRYITPLCPHCNGQHDKEIPVRKDAVYCKELGATREDD